MMHLYGLKKGNPLKDKENLCTNGISWKGTKDVDDAFGWFIENYFSSSHKTKFQ